MEALDPLRDGLEIREEATQPAQVHVGHVSPLGRLLDRVAGLLLGAHEHHGAAATRDARGEVLGVAQQTLGLLEVDDVDAVPLAEDVAPHLRVPAPGLVPEVDACREQVLDADLFQPVSLFVWCAPPAGRCADPV